MASKDKKHSVPKGWVILGGRDPEMEDLGDGMFRRSEGLWRAERVRPGGLGVLTAEAANEEALYEAIANQEAAVANRKKDEQPPSEAPVSTGVVSA